MLTMRRRNHELPEGSELFRFCGFFNASQPAREGVNNDARAAAICTWVLERIDEETRRLNPRFLLGGSWRCWAGMCAAPGTGLAADLALIRIGGRKRYPLPDCGFRVALLLTNPWRSHFCTG